jgi:hypothetical protein
VKGICAPAVNPSATEAAHGVRLLLFWLAVFQFFRSEDTTLGFRVILITVLPSGCPFFRLAMEFLDEVSFRHMMQIPEEKHHFGTFKAEALYFLKP